MIYGVQLFFEFPPEGSIDTSPVEPGQYLDLTPEQSQAFDHETDVVMLTDAEARYKVLGQTALEEPEVGSPTEHSQIQQSTARPTRNRRRPELTPDGTPKANKASFRMKAAADRGRVPEHERYRPY